MDDLADNIQACADAVKELTRELDEKMRLADSWRKSAEGTGREIVKMRERAERAEALLRDVLNNNTSTAIGTTLYERMLRYFDPAPL